MEILVEALGGRDGAIKELDINANPCIKCGKQPRLILIGYSSKPYMVYCECNEYPTEGVGGILENAICQWNKENPIRNKNE